MKKKTRNTLKCQLTGKERITNYSYLGKRLLAIGLDADNVDSLKYFRQHYANEKEVARLRLMILSEGLGEAMAVYGRSGTWLLRVALMNGKAKLFTAGLADAGYAKSIQAYQASVEQSECKILDGHPAFA
jgi:hypothetical protein